MTSPTDTRIVECPECGTSSAYLSLPNGATVSESDSADGNVETTCLNCGREFSVHYSTAASGEGDGR